MTAYTIELTEQEVQYLLACINNDVKANGLNAAQNGIHMASKLQMAVTPPAPVEESAEEVSSDE